MEEKLKLLAKWCLEHEAEIDVYHDGQLEAACKYAASQAVNQVGDYLQEILENDTEWAIKQLKEEE
jgi:hypothetical protein